ncbi:MAG: conjugal transfer protein TraF [Sphingomonadales bacterium]|nr:conjugal transfer protein TraF [Sphingomonadales bacterium]
MGASSSAFAQDMVSVADLGRRYGIFYFYASTCAACRVQNPILYSLRRQGLPVMAISQDEGPNPYFPDYKIDGKLGQRLGVPRNITPTLAAFDSLLRQTVILGSGVIEGRVIVEGLLHLLRQSGGAI